MMRTITNIRPAKTPALSTLSWLLLDAILFSLQSHLLQHHHHHQITTLLVHRRVPLLSTYSTVRNPQKISISELVFPHFTRHYVG